MKTWILPFTLVILGSASLTSQSAFAASDAWIKVFVKETAASGVSRYDYTVQNKSDVPVTGIEIGRRNGCLGDPTLDPSALSDQANFGNAVGFTNSIKLGEGGGTYLRWSGKSSDHRISGFSITGKANSAALNSGYVCVYRADAKVYQYKAAILRDDVVPQFVLSLTPSSFDSDQLFHEVKASLTGRDDQDSDPQIKLLAIRSNVLGFTLAKNVKDASFGEDDRVFQLLADKVGDYSVEYEISDAAGNKGFASATVSVKEAKDVTPPQLILALSPNSINADNKLASITATVTLKDAVDKAPSVKLISITSTATDFNAGNDVKNAVFNSDDRSYQLLAKRTGNIDRIYKITYEAKDAAGNKTSVTQTVTIKAEAKSALQILLDLLADLLRKILALFR